MPLWHSILWLWGLERTFVDCDLSQSYVEMWQESWICAGKSSTKVPACRGWKSHGHMHILFWLDQASRFRPPKSHHWAEQAGTAVDTCTVADALSPQITMYCCKMPSPPSGSTDIAGQEGWYMLNGTQQNTGVSLKPLAQSDCSQEASQISLW